MMKNEDKQDEENRTGSEDTKENGVINETTRPIETTRSLAPNLSVGVRGAPVDGVRTAFQIQTEVKKEHPKTILDEKSENLVSNLCVDHNSTHAWMGAVKNSTNSYSPASSDDDRLPQVFQGCKNLIRLLNPPSCKTLDDGETKSEDESEDDQPNIDTKETNVSDRHDTEIERLQRLPYVKDIAIAATRAISEVLKMTDVSKTYYQQEKTRNNRQQRTRKKTRRWFYPKSRYSPS